MKSRSFIVGARERMGSESLSSEGLFFEPQSCYFQRNPEVPLKITRLLQELILRASNINICVDVTRGYF